jgi:hypothetical protein
MKSLIGIIIILFGGHYLSAQSTDSSVVSNNEIKDFLKDIQPLIMKGTKLFLCEKAEHLKAKEILQKNRPESDTILTNTDIEFMLSQLDKAKNIIWNSKFIGGATFIRNGNIDSIFKNLKKDGGWKLFHKTYGNDFYKMSIPYFSKDKKTAFIYIEYYCGYLCGEGGFKIFRRQNNKWELIDFGISWVS